ncbi:sensor histidine kinase [Isoptericola aurantiacus]|uniref:sensor histidine kinase n=1 Tax=Isoptericola aurantiacus TaxID=3377839 RepID=UPI00383A2192
MIRPEPVTAQVAPALTGTQALLQAPWAPATYRGLAQLVVGWCWLLVVGLPVLICVLTAASLIPALGLGLLLLPLALVLSRWVAAAERARLAAQTGVVVPTPSRRRSARQGWWARLLDAIADARSWAEVAYLLAALLVTSLAVGIVVALASGAVAGVVLLASPAAALGDTTLGIVTTVVAIVVLPWFAAWAAQLGSLSVVLLGRSLLGPSPAAEARAAQRAAEAEARAAESAAATATARADVLTETRAAALEAADAERRRIERDLHDGAQQRLVALGVALGSARRTAERDPAGARAALDHAHGEVKGVLAELRDLVRGIHPAVLADRGLDAALSALAARSPVPVQVEAQPGLERAGTTAQAAAYFVVAEALTNVARHARAEHVWVRAAVVPDGVASVGVAGSGTDPADATDPAAQPDPGPQHLRIEVVDDGRGGAEPGPGSGLAGLRGRVAALDGTFDLTSPAGAGTRLTVELPCAS